MLFHFPSAMTSGTLELNIQLKAVQVGEKHLPLSCDITDGYTNSLIDLPMLRSSCQMPVDQFRAHARWPVQSNQVIDVSNIPNFFTNV